MIAGSISSLSRGFSHAQAVLGQLEFSFAGRHSGTIPAFSAKSTSQPNKTFEHPYICLFSFEQLTMSVQTKATIASFGGKLLKLVHNATTTNCEMGFNLYLPPQTTINPLHKVPLIIYLAGLTCTGDNGAEKGFFQHAASQKGIAILYPDTSPRACSLGCHLRRVLTNTSYH